MFEIIFLAVTGLYFLALIYLTSGLSGKFNTSSAKPSVSIIVAARNEEENILKCMESLAKQDYKDFEVIIADDHSSDNTGNIIDNFILHTSNFKKVISEENTNHIGKTSALISAIKKSSGEVLLFTDADCRPNPGWISGVVKYYTADTGMVNGFSITDSDNIVNGVQSIDLVFLISVAAGMANNGYPASCIGNNMSVKRSVYDQTGGYENLQRSITEDYLLLNSVKKLKKYSIVFPPDESLLVKSEGENSINGLISQKKRWASGGIYSPNISLVLMILAYLTNLLTLLSFFFYSPQVITIIFMKVSSDLFFLYNIHKKFNLTKNLKYFPFFEVYYLLYTTLLPLLLLFDRKIRWKEREY